MDNCDVMSSTDQTITALQDLIQIANDKSVEDMYMQQANKLSTKMKGNLNSREIYALLEAYPEREYPAPEPLDKNGKPLKKDKNEKPKKKKKEPPFPVPDWAVELDAVQMKVKALQQLIQNSKEYMMDAEFLQKCDVELKRFNNEIRYRKQQDEEARLDAEAKALAKKKA